MRTPDGSFESSPWGHMGAWGRGVNVESEASVALVQRLISESDPHDRCGVMFPMLPRRERRRLRRQIEALGISLRPLDRGDRELMRAERLGATGFVALTASLPAFLVMCLAGRKTEIFQAMPAGEPSAG